MGVVIRPSYLSQPTGASCTRAKLTMPNLVTLAMTLPVVGTANQRLKLSSRFLAIAFTSSRSPLAGCMRVLSALIWPNFSAILDGGGGVLWP
jgi:hypothetical protein